MFRSQGVLKIRQMMSKKIQKFIIIWKSKPETAALNPIAPHSQELVPS